MDSAAVAWRGRAQLPRPRSRLRQTSERRSLACLAERCSQALQALLELIEGRPAVADAHVVPRLFEPVSRPDECLIAVEQGLIEAVRIRAGNGLVAHAEEAD